MTTAAADATSRRILDAALEVFVRHGFAATSTDQIAAGASASKQTIYKRFGDKEGLFRALTDHVIVEVRAHIVAVDLTAAPDVEAAVRLLADQFTRSVLDPRVQRIRRLMIAEATRFPEVGRAYYEGAFTTTLEVLGGQLAQLADRGWLRLDDPVRAANHLAGLLLWVLGNRIMMTGDADSIGAGELRANTDAGVRAFLAAYRA